MASSFSRERLHTVQLVPITAFDAQGRLALAPMRALTQRLFDAGVRVFIPCAGSAEFHTLTEDEILAAVSMTREVVGSAGTVVVPVGHNLEQSLRLGRRAAEAGADCVLVMPLDFPYLSDPGARDYFRALFDGLPLPAMIYKKAELPTDKLLLELATHPNLIGVKYAVNDVDAFNRIVQDDRGRIDWYCGTAERFSPFFMLVGAKGYTSGAGNLCPKLTLAMHRAIVAGNWPEALRLQRLIQPIEVFRARAANSFNISFLKYAIRHLGLDFGEPRPPYRRLTPEECREIDALMPSLLAAEAAC